MKRKFRIIVGMLLLAIPLCMNAQVNPTKGESTKPGTKPKSEKVEPKKAKPGNATKPEKTDKTEQSEKTDKTVKATKTDKTENTEKTVKVSKPERAEKTVKAEKPEKAENPEKSEKLLSGLELPKISGFVQGMYQMDFTDEFQLSDNTLRMRRVRVSVDGTLFKGLTYKIQGDFSRSPTLVDAYVKYKPCNEFAIQVGQFKTPFTIESPINPLNLDIFDYGEAVQQLGGYKDVCGVGGLGRDIGVMASGSLFPMKGNYSLIDYAVGVFNGNGPTALDNNNRKDIVGRLEVHPGLKALTLSGSYYYGNYYKDENYNGVRNRWAAGLQYNDGKLVIRGEYLGGTTGYQGFEGEEAPKKFNSMGCYAEAGYYFHFGKEQKLMPVLRYEHFEQQTGILGPHTADHVVYYLPNASAPTSYYTVGINYWPIKSLNFKLDYSLVDGYKNIDGNYNKNYSHRMVAILSYKF